MSDNLFRVCTANVQGLAGHHQKLLPFYDYLTQHPSSIYVLSETNLATSSALLYPPPDHITLHTTRDPHKPVGSGVALLLGDEIRVLHPPTVLVPGYAITVTIQWETLSIVLYAIYSAPAVTQPSPDYEAGSLLQHIISTITTHATTTLATFPSCEIMLVGDLNAAFRTLDKSNIAARRTKADQAWTTLALHLSLHDATSIKHPTQPNFTLLRTPNRSTPDHILVSSTLVPALHRVTTAHGVLRQGDHTPLHVTLNPLRRNGTPFRYPSSPTNRVPMAFLENETLAAAVKFILANHPAPPLHATVQMVWDNFLTLQSKLKSAICKFSARVARTERRRTATLTRALHLIASTRPRDAIHAQTLSAMAVLHELDLTALQKTQSARRVAFINMTAQVDLPVLSHVSHARSAYKLKSPDREMSELIHPIMQTRVRDQAGHLECAHIFYSALFQRPTRGTPWLPPLVTPPDELPDVSDTEYRELLSRDKLPQLSPAQADTLLTPPTLDDALALLCRLQPNAAPGPDGLANAFYRQYADEIAPHILHLLQAFHSSGYIPPVVKLGIVTPFFKGAGERAELKNWRPITLLNTTYKIMALYLCARLTPLLPHIVGTGQTSSVPGRTSASNVLSIQLSIVIASLQKVDAVFLFIDSEKAFDNVNWSYLWDALGAFGLPPLFISLCQGLYTDARVMVNVNGQLSPLILLEKGVRQGCPLSPLLYILYLEPIRLKIHQLNGPASEWLPATVPSTMAHADDLAIVTNLQSVPLLMNTLASLQRRTGLKVNPAKSYALQNHDDPLPADFPVPIEHISSHSHTYLGARVGGPQPDLDTSELTTARLVRQLQTIAKSGGLPLLARAALVRSTTAGVMQYFLQIVHFSRPALAKIQAATRLAFWGATSTKHTRARLQSVRSERLFLPQQNGGTGIHDLQQWQGAFFRKVLNQLQHGAPLPQLHAQRDLPARDTAWIVLFKHLVTLIARTHHIERDVRALLWWPTDALTIIASDPRLPAFWRAALNHHLATRPTQVLTDHNSRPDQLFFAQLSATAAPDRFALSPTFTVAVRHEGPPPRCPFPLPMQWASVMTHPAYMLHLPAADDPIKPGSLVRHYYQVACTQLLTTPATAATRSPVYEWGPVLGQDVLTPEQTSAALHLLLKGRLPDQLKTHAWLLWQRRMQTSYFPCPFCQRPPLPLATDNRSTQNFSHVAWNCPAFRRMWMHSTRSLSLPTFQTLAPIVLGQLPRGGNIDVTTRRDALLLHAAIFQCRWSIQAASPVDGGFPRMPVITDTLLAKVTNTYHQLQKEQAAYHPLATRD